MIGVLIADTLLAAGLWLAFRMVLRQVGAHRPRPTALLAMLALVVLLILVGVAPDFLPGTLDLSSVDQPEISVWGLGLVYVLPWLAGGWLARIGLRVAEPLQRVASIASLDWLFRATNWIAQKLVGGIYWLGRVGEGEGWWGWALIILALGAIMLTVR
jgi:hypothetical protein